MGVSSAGESCTWQEAQSVSMLMRRRAAVPIAAQFGVALHLSRREDCRRRKMIFEMGLAKLTLRDRDRGR